MVEVKEIVVVCDPSYRDIFEGFFFLSLALVSFVDRVLASWLLIIFFPQMRKEITKLNSNSHCLEKKDRILFTMGFRNVQLFYFKSL